MQRNKSNRDDVQRTDWNRSAWAQQLKKIVTDAKKTPKQYLYDSEVPGGGE